MADAMGPIVFVVVIFGGLGSLAGCFIASILMGMVQTFSVVADWSFADLVSPFGITLHANDLLGEILTIPVSRIGPLVPYALLILILLFRPRGLMGPRDMSDAAVRALPSRRARALAVRLWPWIVALLISIALPWLFYDWQHGRHSGFVLSMLSQMGMMIIFALSFNMLMGQAGLLSFCHSVLFGLAGYSTVHFLNAAGSGELPVPMELIPLLSGLSGFGFAVVFGYMATKQRSTAFAMITSESCNSSLRRRRCSTTSSAAKAACTLIER